MNDKESKRQFGTDQVAHSLKGAALISGILVVIKTGAYAMSGSMLVLASLLDSVADTAVSATNFYINKVARSDADKEHPFGHGGFEVVGSLVQGLMIGFLGVSLLIESGRNLFRPNLESLDSSRLPFAALVLLASALGGVLIQIYLQKGRKKIEENEDRSLTLDADYSHYAADVIANFAAAIGILVVWFTEIKTLDAIFGIGASILLIKTSYPIIKKCFIDIVHQEVSPDMQQKIVDTVIATDKRIKGIHQLRTRELGVHLFVDFHMTLSGNLSLEAAHALSDKVELAIKNAIPRADIIIHLDPENEPEHNQWKPAYNLPGKNP